MVRFSSRTPRRWSRRSPRSSAQTTRSYAELLKAPHCMFAAGAASEIGAGDQNRRDRIGWAVQHEVGTSAPLGVEPQVVQQPLLEAGLIDAAQELLGHDLVGIEVSMRSAAAQTLDEYRFVHCRISSWRTSVMRPVTAAAAAMAGLIKCVIAPRPWRPSKLRFVVEAQRSPSASTSSTATIVRPFQRSTQKPSLPNRDETRSAETRQSNATNSGQSSGYGVSGFPTVTDRCTK